jgi:hypothetical protein
VVPSLQTEPIDGLAIPDGGSATVRYTLVADEGSLRMLTPRDGAQTLLREPLAPGADGWPRVLKTHVPARTGASGSAAAASSCA